MIEHGKLMHFAPGEGVTKGAHRPGFSDSNWFETTIPGCAHSILISAGEIPDPFFDQNETGCAWMEEREWWYRIAVDSIEGDLDSEERLRLIFHGLDTFATIYLDGDEIGRHQNMFRPFEADISSKLTVGNSLLIALRFDPPLARISGKTLSVWGRNVERSAMRKAQFGYGWDWGPRLPTIGVWLPAEVRRERTAILSGVHFSTLEIAPNQSRAAVRVRVQTESFAASDPLSARVALRAGDETIS